MTQMDLRVPGSTIFVLAGLIIIAAGLRASQELMVPFLLSVFIATMAATPMLWMQRKGVPAGFSLPLVMVLMVAAIVMLGGLVAQSASAFTAKLPFYQERLLLLQDDLSSWLLPMLAPLGIESLDFQLRNFSPNMALELAGTTLARLSGVLSNSILIVLTVVFILAEAASFPTKLRRVLADPDEQLPHFAKFAENMNRYIAIKTTVSFATGVAAASLLWFMDVDFPILWGLLAFLLNYVPTIGSIIAAIPPVLLALIQISPAAAGGVAAGMVFINLLFGNFVEPKFMGRGLGLSALVVFLSLVLWGWILGPVGMLLSVPLTMTAKIALEANPSTHWIALLLGPADALDAPAAEAASEPSPSASQDPATTDAESKAD